MASRCNGPGFQPFLSRGNFSLGVAQGWYGVGPSALRTAGFKGPYRLQGTYRLNGGPKARTHTSPGQRPGNLPAMNQRAESPIHPAASRCNGPGFQPFLSRGNSSLGVAQGWYGVGPSALRTAGFKVPYRLQEPVEIPICGSFRAERRGGRRRRGAQSRNPGEGPIGPRS